MSESKVNEKKSKEYTDISCGELKNEIIKDLTENISMLLRIYSVNVILVGRDASIAKTYLIQGNMISGTRFEWMVITIQGNLVPARKYRQGTKKRDYILKCTIFIRFELSCNLFECGKSCSIDLCYNKHHVCNRITIPYRFEGTKKVNTRSTSRSINNVALELYNTIIPFVNSIEMTGDKIYTKEGREKDIMSLDMFTFLNPNYDSYDTHIENIEIDDKCMVCFEPTRRQTSCCKNKCCMSCVGKIRYNRCPICRDSGPRLKLECICREIICKNIGERC